MGPWIAPGAGEHLRRQQAQDDAVLVGRPHTSVHPQETRARAFLAAETEAAVEEPRRKIFEAHGHFAQRAFQAQYYAVDQAAAHQRFANHRRRRPTGPVAEQIADGRREVMVRVHQAPFGRHDAVAVGIRVRAESDVESVLEVHQAGHRVGTRAIHANLSVVIHRHETERRVRRGVHYGDIQPVALLDRFPIRQGGPAKGIHTDLDPGYADGFQIDDRGQVLHVRGDIIKRPRGGRLQREGVGHAQDFAVAAAQQFVGPLLDPAGDVVFRRATVRRVVLYSTIGRRIMRGRDD